MSTLAIIRTPAARLSWGRKPLQRTTLPTQPLRPALGASAPLLAQSAVLLHVLRILLCPTHTLHHMWRVRTRPAFKEVRRATAARKRPPTESMAVRHQCLHPPGVQQLRHASRRLPRQSKDPWVPALKSCLGTSQLPGHPLRPRHSSLHSDPSGHDSRGRCGELATDRCSALRRHRGNRCSSD